MVSVRQARSGIPHRITGAVALGLWAVLQGGSSARALECPVPHPSVGPTAIKQTDEGIRADKNLLTAQGTGAIPKIAARLKQEHPSAPAAEITNYLLTAYCPVLNENTSLSEAEKRERLMAFSARLMQELASDK